MLGGISSQNRKESGIKYNLQRKCIDFELFNSYMAEHILKPLGKKGVLYD